MIEILRTRLLLLFQSHRFAKLSLVVKDDAPMSILLSPYVGRRFFFSDSSPFFLPSKI